MKKYLTLLALILTLSSCSFFDRWKTPEGPNAGLDEGEKSSYLLNKPESKESAVVEKSQKTKKKTVKKKKKLN